jgi:hypothetical protein
MKFTESERLAPPPTALYDLEGEFTPPKIYSLERQAYGPIITGHAHPHITEAIQDQAAKGVLYGTPTELLNDFVSFSISTSNSNCCHNCFSTRVHETNLF